MFRNEKKTNIHNERRTHNTLVCSLAADMNLVQPEAGLPHPLCLACGETKCS